MAVVRVNMSVPEHVKQEMDRVAACSDVNWSAVATAAFVKALQDMSKGTYIPEPDLQTLGQRLRTIERMLGIGGM